MEMDVGMDMGMGINVAPGVGINTAPGSVPTSVYEPLEDFVLVRPDVVSDDVGGMKMVGRQREQSATGVVFLIGPCVRDVAVGDKVVYTAGVGAAVDIGSMGYVSLHEDDILMVN